MTDLVYDGFKINVSATRTRIMESISNVSDAQGILAEHTQQTQVDAIFRTAARRWLARRGYELDTMNPGGAMVKC